MATIDEINLLDYQAPTPEQILKAGRKPVAEPIPLEEQDPFYYKILNPSGRKLVDMVRAEINNPLNYLAGAGGISKADKLRRGIAGIGHNQGPPLDTAPKYLSPRTQTEYNLLESRAFEKSQRDDKPMPKYFTDEIKKDQFFARKSNVTDDEFEVFAEWIESNKDQNIKNKVADVIKANKERSLGISGFSRGFGRIDDISQKHLFKNNLVDADGNVTLYRAINLGKGEKLMPDEGLVSTTIDPKYVTNLAEKESIKTKFSVPKDKQGEVSMFDTGLDLFMKGIELEKQVMKRTPMIVEYKVPVNKVEAYLPAILNKMDDLEINSVASKRAYRDYGDEIAEREDVLRAEGYEDMYGVDDEVIHEFGIKEDILDTLYNADLESEVILNATDLKPSRVFTLNEFTQGGKGGVAQGISNRQQQITKLQRELELEGGDMLPKTVKSIERKIARLMKEIDEMSK